MLLLPVVDAAVVAAVRTLLHTLLGVPAHPRHPPIAEPWATATATATGGGEAEAEAGMGAGVWTTSAPARRHWLVLTRTAAGMPCAALVQCGGACKWARVTAPAPLFDGTALDGDVDGVGAFVAHELLAVAGAAVPRSSFSSNLDALRALVAVADMRVLVAAGGVPHAVAVRAFTFAAAAAPPTVAAAGQEAAALHIAEHRVSAALGLGVQPCVRDAWVVTPDAAPGVAAAGLEAAPPVKAETVGTVGSGRAKAKGKATRGTTSSASTTRRFRA